MILNPYNLDLNCSGVYLLHFSPKIHHAFHYLGYGSSIAGRIACHESGNGARLVKVAIERGRIIWIARIWPGESRHFERRMKRDRKNNSKLCPICKDQKTIYSKIKKLKTQMEK